MNLITLGIGGDTYLGTELSCDPGGKLLKIFAMRILAGRHPASLVGKMTR